MRRTIGGSTPYYLCWTGPNVKGYSGYHPSDVTTLTNQGVLLLTYRVEADFDAFVGDFASAGDQA